MWTKLSFVEVNWEFLFGFVFENLFPQLTENERFKISQIVAFSLLVSAEAIYNIHSILS